MSSVESGRSSKELIAQIKQAEFAKKADLLGQLCECDNIKRELQQHLVNGLTMQRVVNAVVRLARVPKNSKLFEASPVSLVLAVAEAAGYGWEIGGVLGHAWLVPYGGVVQMQPGYKGMLDLCYRAGGVVSVGCECVHEGDEFEHVSGDEERIVHKPKHDPQRHLRRITHVYASIKLKTGGYARCVWTTEQIDSHKERYSKAWNSPDSAWKTAWPAMAKKTVLLQAIRGGKVPMSMEARQLLDRVETDTPTTFDVVPVYHDDAIEHEETQAPPTQQNKGATT